MTLNHRSLLHGGLVTAALLLGGCGGDVAGTAVTAAKLQAQQAQQAKAQQKEIETKLGEAMKAVDASASAASAE